MMKRVLNTIKICLMHQTNLHPVFITCNMNKKRFTEFSNYLEGFTQKIVTRFPESIDFVDDEKAQMLERFAELASVQPKSQPSQISVIEYTLKSSLNEERRKSYCGVEDEIKRNTPEECVDAINTLSRAIGNAHKDILFYSALQGDLLSSMKEAFSSSFAVLLRNNINISRSHAFFLMKFHRLIIEHPKLLQCELPLNYFQKNFSTIKTICEREKNIWKDL